MHACHAWTQADDEFAEEYEPVRQMNYLSLTQLDYSHQLLKPCFLFSFLVVRDATKET